MNPKWYLLGIKGSLDSSMAYVHELTGRINCVAKDNEVFGVNNSTSTISNMSRQTSKKTIRKKAIKKPLKKNCELCKNQCPAKKVVEEDSKLIKMFFKEVRNRELKNYYAQMIAKDNQRNHNV